MDFGMENVAADIASSTTNYLVEFSPVILLIAGLALAFAFMDRLIDVFRGADKIEKSDG